MKMNNYQFFYRKKLIIRIIYYSFYYNYGIYYLTNAGMLTRYLIRNNHSLARNYHRPKIRPKIRPKNRLKNRSKIKSLVPYKNKTAIYSPPIFPPLTLQNQSFVIDPSLKAKLLNKYNYRFSYFEKLDNTLSSTINKTTNFLRGFSFYSTKYLGLFTNKVNESLIAIKKFNQEKLPTKIIKPSFRPFIHANVVFLKNVAIVINKAFDGGVKIVIFFAKNIGKAVAEAIIWTIDYMSLKSKYSYVPKTAKSIKHFITVTVDESFIIIEALDVTLTSIFGSLTDTTLQTIEHVFGEDVKGITEELSLFAKESFEFYKKVKLLKMKNILQKSTKEGTKETIKIVYKSINNKKKRENNDKNEDRDE